MFSGVRERVEEKVWNQIVKSQIVALFLIS